MNDSRQVVGAWQPPRYTAHDEPPEGFLPFSPNVDLKIEERIKRLPRHHTVKGMFFRPLAARLRAVHPELAPINYFFFRDYPAIDFMHMLLRAAEVLHPELSTQEAIRRLGRLQYGGILDYSPGRALFSFAFLFGDALRFVPHAYTIFGRGATAELRSLTSSTAIISLRNSWDFGECHQVGLYEGGFDAFQVEGKVWIKPISLFDLDVALFWKKP